MSVDIKKPQSLVPPLSQWEPATGTRRFVMFKTRSFWTLAALVAVTTVAAAQTHVRGNRGDVGGKVVGVVGESGLPVCFGDGSWGRCPVNNPGAPGHGCNNSLGTGGAVLSAQGIPSLAKDTMMLSVAELPAGTTAVFMQGRNLSNPSYPFGDGLMCLGGQVLQLGMKRTAGGVSVFPDFGDQSLSQAGKIPYFGRTVVYQVLYRDVGFVTGTGRFDTFNLSNAWFTSWIP
jgi:hypothetical protein